MTRRTSRTRWIGGWVATLALSLVYYVIVANCLVFGGILAWNGWQRFDTDRGTGTLWIVLAIVLIAIGLIVFVRFPRLVHRWTGREVVSSPYT